MFRRIILITAVVLASFWAALPTTQPVQASSASWTATFYNNAFLQDPSVVTQSVSVVAFDWGAGAPVAGVGADNFSARFTATVNFPAGTYRFCVLADDSVNLFVGGVRIISSFNQNLAAQTLTADITLSGGNQGLQLDFQELGGNAYVYLGWTNLASNPTCSLPTASAPPPSGGGSSQCTVQFFNSTDLSGAAVATIGVSNPTVNWGAGSPWAGVNADNFSARFTCQYTLTGTYELRLNVDDGVRAFVNGVNVIDRFGVFAGQTFAVNVNLAGPNTVVLEYVEFTGNAYLNFSLNPVGSVAPPAPGPSTGITASIATSVLNVRNQPNRFTGAVLVKVRRGEVYPAVGRNQDSSWVQINVNGTVGWVNSRYVVVSNIGGLAVVSTTANEVPAPTGYTVTTRVRVNMRGAPALGTTVVAVFPPNNVAQVLGRTADNRWYKIVYNDVVGWVSADFVIPQQAFDFNRIPVMPI